MWDYLKLVAFGLVAVLAAYAASQARDVAYLVHAILVMLIGGGMFVYSLRRIGEPKAEKTGYLDAPIRIGVALTAFWGAVGFLVGTFIAFQLAFPSLNFGWAEGYLNLGVCAPCTPRR